MVPKPESSKIQTPKAEHHKPTTKALYRKIRYGFRVQNIQREIRIT